MRKFLAVFLLALLPSGALAWTETSHWNTVAEGGWTCQSYTAGGTFPGTHYSISAMSSPDPPNVLRWNFPTGFPGNHELGMCWNPFPAEAEEIWVQYYFKYSPNWTVGTGSKLIFILVGGGGNVFTSFTGGSKRFYFTTQTYATNSYPPNVGPQPTMVNGTWYKHTLHLKMNTAGVLDGIVEMWVDDVLTTRYTNVGYRPASQAGRGFFDITINTGKANVAAGAGEYVLYDHTIVSTSKIGDTPGGDPNPPYTDQHSPAKSSTGRPPSHTLSWHVKDNRTNDTGVSLGTISATIEGTEYTCSSGLTCSGSSSDYTVSRAVTFSYDQVINVSIDASDIAGNAMPTDAYSYTIQSDPVPALAVTTTTMPQGRVGTAYTSTTLAATGGVSPYTWAVVSGTYPPGLGLSSVGVVAGTPTAAGTYNFTVRVTDTVSSTDDQALSITVLPKAPDDGGTEQNKNYADTWISSLDTTTNFDNSATLRVYQWPASTISNLSVVVDNASIQALPDNVLIKSATLRLFLPATGGYDGSGGTNPMRVHCYTLSGTLPDTTTLTWANQAFTKTELSVTDVALISGWYSWDVTTAVRTAYGSSPRQPVYLALDGGSDSAQDTNRYFLSVDNPDDSLHPELVIDYTTLTEPGGGSISVPGKMKPFKCRCLWQ